MNIYLRKKFTSIQNLLARIPAFSHESGNSLTFLNIAQSLGVLNDNIFKLVMVYLLIDLQGNEKASGILALAGAIFVIPFLLFSSSAGVLADRFSKQKLLVLMKCVEMGIMLLAIIAFAYKISWACYTLLFLLATHSALFGPSKYGIIPELVPKNKVSRANGIITSFTYLAIILGTFLASFLTEVSNRKFPLLAGFCLFVAFGGFISTFGIKPTEPQGSTKSFNLFFISDIVKTLIACKETPHLLMAIFGSAYFLFIGSFVQLNIIPFALESLRLSEIAGGYLFLSTAFGIALGAFTIGKLLKKRINLGASCVAAFFIAVCLSLLTLFSTHLHIVVGALFFLGFFGGVFIVPFDSFIQMNSPDESRGQVIGASNFLSFLGVLVASFALYLFGDVFAIKASSGFGIISVITLLFFILSIYKLSIYFFPLLSKWKLKLLYTINVNNSHFVYQAKTLLILPHAHLRDVRFLQSAFPTVHFLFPSVEKHKPNYLKNIYPLRFLEENEFNGEKLLALTNKFSKEDKLPCLILPFTLTPEEFIKEANLHKLFGHSAQFFTIQLFYKKRRTVTIDLVK